MSIKTVQFIKPIEPGEDRIVLDVSGPGAGAQGYTLSAGSLESAYFAQRTSTAEVVASLPGSRPGRDRVDARRITWIVRVEHAGVAVPDRASDLLWRVIAPGRPFVARVVSEDGSEAREITLYRIGAPVLRRPPNTPAVDPSTLPWIEWEIDTVAHDPWWYGAASTDEYVTSSSGTHSETLRVRNDGDQPAWPRYIIAEASGDQDWTVPDGLGVYPAGHDRAGQRIEYPVPTVPAGLHALVESDPLRLPFSLPDRPMSFAMTRQRRFVHPLPPRSGEVEMPVTVTGPAGAGIRVKVRPVHERPWGW